MNSKVRDVRPGTGATGETTGRTGAGPAETVPLAPVSTGDFIDATPALHRYRTVMNAETYARRSARWSSHAEVENVGIKATLEIVEFDPDGIVSAVVHVKPGEKVSLRPTAHRRYSVALTDG